MDSRIRTMFMKIDIESGGKVDWVRYRYIYIYRNNNNVDVNNNNNNNI